MRLAASSFFEDLEEFVRRFSVDAREGRMGHLGQNEVS
jgi:hypothetical protein